MVNAEADMLWNAGYQFCCYGAFVICNTYEEGMKSQNSKDRLNAETQANNLKRVKERELTSLPRL